MAGKKTEIGPTGDTVRENLRIHRERQRLTFAELSRLLKTKADREIPPLGLRRAERGERKIDVDDLLSLAVALNVPPTALLMPDAASAQTDVELTALGTVAAGDAWEWLVATKKPLVIGEGTRETLDWFTARPQFLARSVEQIRRDIEDGDAALKAAMRANIDGDD